MSAFFNHVASIQHNNQNVNSVLDTMNRTSVFIAHRLRTIEDADLIIVLDRGHMVEEGTHESLLASPGLYHNLWMAQIERIHQDEQDSEEQQIQTEQTDVPMSKQSST